MNGPGATLERAPARDFGLARLVKTKFVIDVSRLASFNFLSAFIIFAQGLLVARWLGPTEYGIAALVMNYPNVLFGLLDARTGSATVRYFTRFRAEGRSDKALALCKMSYLMDLGISLATLGAVALSARWAATHVVHRPEYAALIVLFSASLVPRAFASTSTAVFAVFSKFRLSGWIELSTAVLRTALILSLVYAGAGVRGVVMGGLAASAVSGVVSAAVCYRLLRREEGASWITAPLSSLKAERKEILRFVAFTDLTELLTVVVKQLDLTMLGFFCGPREAGFYRLAKSFSSAIGLAVSPLQSVIYPRLASPSSHTVLETLLSSLKDLARRWGLPALVLIAAAIYVGPLLFVLVAGPQYAPIVGATRVLLVCYSFWILFFWLRPYYYGQGLVAQWTRGTVFYSLSFLALAPFLSLAAGAVGMAVAFSVATIGFYVLMLRPFASVMLPWR